jgi:hypothetical protein
LDVVVVDSCWPYTSIVNKLYVVPQSEKTGHFEDSFGMSGLSCVQGVGAAGHLLGEIPHFVYICLLPGSSSFAASTQHDAAPILLRYGAYRSHMAPCASPMTYSAPKRLRRLTSAPPAARFEEYSYSAASHQPFARTAGNKERLRICTLYRALQSLDTPASAAGVVVATGFSSDPPRLPATASLSRS